MSDKFTNEIMTTIHDWWDCHLDFQSFVYGNIVLRSLWRVLGIDCRTVYPILFVAVGGFLGDIPAKTQGCYAQAGIPASKGGGILLLPHRCG